MTDKEKLIQCFEELGIKFEERNMKYYGGKSYQPTIAIRINDFACLFYFGLDGKYEECECTEYLYD
jgi:hypothetical protein